MRELTMEIRASMIDTFNDCETRAIAKQWPAEVEQRCGALRQMHRRIALVMGNSFHAGAAGLLRLRMTTRAPLVFSKEILEPAYSSLEEQLRERAVIPDAATSGVSAARVQLRQMVERYVPFLNTLPFPSHVEHRLQAPLRQDVIKLGQEYVRIYWVVAGSMDWRTETGWIRDHKTGRQKRSCIGQGGTYARLAMYHGIDVHGIAQDFSMRTQGDQPAPETEPYDPFEAQMHSYQTAMSIAEKMLRFLQTGDPWIFRKNSMSSFCGSEWCPAWQTGLCTVGRGSLVHA